MDGRKMDPEQKAQVGEIGGSIINIDVDFDLLDEGRHLRSTRIRMADVSTPKLLCYIFYVICEVIISIGAIIIGAMYLKDCPAEPDIPVMLLTFGVISIASRIFASLYDGNKEGLWIWLQLINSLLEFAMLALFIYTCVIVYRAYSTVTYTYAPPDLNMHGEAGGADEANHYCHRVIYLCSIWYCTIGLTFLVILLFVVQCLCICLPRLSVVPAN